MSMIVSACVGCNWEHQPEPTASKVHALLQGQFPPTQPESECDRENWVTSLDKFHPKDVCVAIATVIGRPLEVFAMQDRSIVWTRIGIPNEEHLPRVLLDERIQLISHGNLEYSCGVILFSGVESKKKSLRVDNETIERYGLPVMPRPVPPIRAISSQYPPTTNAPVFTGDIFPSAWLQSGKSTVLNPPQFKTMSSTDSTRVVADVSHGEDQIGMDFQSQPLQSSSDSVSTQSWITPDEQVEQNESPAPKRRHVDCP